MNLGDRVLLFQKTYILPIVVNFDGLTRDDKCWGICQINNKANFYKSCKKIFNSTKMDPFKFKYDKNGNGIDVPVQARVSN